MTPLLAALVLAGCPARLPAPGPAAGGALVRPGATSLLLCRYAGLDARLRLVSSAAVRGRAAVARVTRELDALPPLRGTYHCPFDDGSAIVAAFGYANGSRDRVRVGLKGCRIVTDGRVTRTAMSRAGVPLLGLLERLLR